MLAVVPCEAGGFNGVCVVRHAGSSAASKESEIPNRFAELMVRGATALVLQESPLGADADRVADPRGDPERTPTPSFSRAARLPPSPQRSCSDAVRPCKRVGDKPADTRCLAPREVHKAMAAGEHVVEVPVPHQAASSAISCSGG